MPVPERAALTKEQVLYYQRIDKCLSNAAEFVRGDEFYGKILSLRHFPGHLYAEVKPIVGLEMLTNNTCVHLYRNDDWSGYSPPFKIENISSVADGSIQMELEIPENNLDEKIFYADESLIVTTNCNALPFRRKILAAYDSESILVYQAYRKEIAEEAVALQKFGDHFSRSRWTWIKPSFFWMMYRSGWATKPGQEHILAIRLKREAFESILAHALVTDPTLFMVYESEHDYRSDKAKRPNRVQWDPERTIDVTKAFGRRAIQVGIHPLFHSTYIDGITSIEDITLKAGEIYKKSSCGDKCWDLLPTEVPYPTPLEFLRMLEMHQYYTGEDKELMTHFLKIYSS